MSTKERISTQFTLQPAAEAPELLAEATAKALPTVSGDVDVFAIDPQIADTAALLGATALPPATSAN